jgi:hypothetical protein
MTQEEVNDLALKEFERTRGKDLKERFHDVISILYNLGLREDLRENAYKVILEKSKQEVLEDSFNFGDDGLRID